MTYTTEPATVCVVEYSASTSTKSMTPDTKAKEKNNMNASTDNSKGVRAVVTEAPVYSYDERNHQFRTKVKSTSRKLVSLCYI